MAPLGMAVKMLNIFVEVGYKITTQIVNHVIQEGAILMTGITVTL